MKIFKPQIEFWIYQKAFHKPIPLASYYDNEWGVLLGEKLWYIYNSICGLTFSHSSAPHSFIAGALNSYKININYKGKK